MTTYSENMPIPTILIVANIKKILNPRLVIIPGVTFDTTKSDDINLKCKLTNKNDDER